MTMRERYENKLRSLMDDISRMCDLVSRQISNALKALLESDLELAREVEVGDKLVNKMQVEIERQCLKLFLREQPVASDFREVIACLKTVTDLERIGDHAEDISHIVIELGKNVDTKKYGTICEMAAATIEMQTASFDSFLTHNFNKAKQTIMMDDVIDSLFAKCKKRIVEVVKKDSALADEIVLVLMIAKYMERICDHSANVCEWTEYYLNGKLQGE